MRIVLYNSYVARKAIFGSTHIDVEEVIRRTRFGTQNIIYDT